MADTWGGRGGSACSEGSGLAVSPAAITPSWTNPERCRGANPPSHRYSLKISVTEAGVDLVAFLEGGCRTCCAALHRSLCPASHSVRYTSVLGVLGPWVVKAKWRAR